MEDGLYCACMPHNGDVRTLIVNGHSGREVLSKYLDTG